MPDIIVKEPFKFAHNGNEVVDYDVGTHTVSDRCALVAVEHLGVAEYADKAKQEKPAKRRTANKE